MITVKILPVLRFPENCNTRHLLSTIRELRLWDKCILGDIHNRLYKMAQLYNSLFASLRDPLSEYMPEGLRKPLLTNRSESESILVEQNGYNVRAAVRGVEGFSELLLHLARRLDSGHDSFRQKDAVTEASNSRIVYPSSEIIIKSIQLLAIQVDRNIDSDPLVCAIYTMVSIWSIHPFADGNGRLGRVLFNSIIRQTGISGCYIPLYELSLVSDAGGLLATRRAQQQNDWDPIVRYLAAGVSLCLSLQLSDNGHL